MQPKEDAIVDIPEDRLRFFGGAGKMLLPGPATVAALIEKVPAHKLITTNLLCRKLAQQFNVRGTCPVTTQKALQAVAHDPSNEVAYWRVIKVSGGTHQSVSRRRGWSGGTPEKRGLHAR